MTIENEIGSTIYPFQLKIKFKPKNFVKVLEGTTLKESRIIMIKFLSYPKPSKGSWKIENVTIPVGNSEVDGFNSSSFYSGKPLSDEYLLYIQIDSFQQNWTDKFHSLNVTNDVGWTIYQFKFEKEVNETTLLPTHGYSLEFSIKSFSCIFDLSTD